MFTSAPGTSLTLRMGLSITAVRDPTKMAWLCALNKCPCALAAGPFIINY